MFKSMLAVVVCAGAVAVPSAQDRTTMTAQTNAPETFTAFAVNMSNTAPRAATSPVDIHIDRYSTDAERDRLMKVFDEQGQDGLLKALQDMPVVGYIRTPTSLRYDLHFARQIPQAEGGRKIVLLTDRYMAMWEVVNRPRSVDYPFTLIQLQVDKDGNGVGKASIATRITKEDNVIELEDFANVPVMLNDVKKTK